MALSSKVDVHASDRGLATCFQAANVQHAWSSAFLKVHKAETLDDFVYLVDGDKWEASLEGLLKAVPELGDSRLVLARFKSAYATGLDAMKQAKVVSVGSAEELEQPIPEAKLQHLQNAWHKTYGTVLDPHLEPSDALRGRVWREFSRGTMTVLEIKKVRSLLMQSLPTSNEVIKLQDSSRGPISLSFAREQDTAIQDVVAYFFGLRVLMNAFAFCGNFVFKDVDGVERRFISLSQAQDYADHCLRDAMSYGQGSVQWLQHNDLLTRGKMASKIRRGYSAGRALTEALSECHLEWRSPSVGQPLDATTPPKKRPLPADVPSPPPGANRRYAERWGSHLQVLQRQPWM